MTEASHLDISDKKQLWKLIDVTKEDIFRLRMECSMLFHKLLQVYQLKDRCNRALVSLTKITEKFKRLQDEKHIQYRKITGKQGTHSKKINIANHKSDSTSSKRKSMSYNSTHGCVIISTMIAMYFVNWFEGDEIDITDKRIKEIVNSESIEHCYGSRHEYDPKFVATYEFMDIWEVEDYFRKKGHFNELQLHDHRIVCTGNIFCDEDMSILIQNLTSGDDNKKACTLLLKNHSICILVKRNKEEKSYTFDVIDSDDTDKDLGDCTSRSTVGSIDSLKCCILRQAHGIIEEANDYPHFREDKIEQYVLQSHPCTFLAYIYSPILR